VRHAPPVGVTGSGQGVWRAALAAAPALAGAALAAWWPLPSGGVVLAGLAGAAAGWFVAPPKPFALRWDGERWQADGVPGRTDVMLDLGSWMLLRHRADGRGTRWLAVTRREAAAAWPALRAALFAR